MPAKEKELSALIVPFSLQKSSIAVKTPLFTLDS